jgi:hypothetical protein
MATPITDAVAAAKAKAAQLAAAAPAPTTANAVAPVANNTNVPATTGGGRRMSLDDLNNGGLSVDAYLKVKEDGLKIGEKTNLIESINVIIRLEQVLTCQVVKYGDPATYLKTYDQERTVTGGSWQQALQTAAQFGATPYMSADIPMVLAEDAKDIKGVVVDTTGKKLGYSLSTTNLANFREFMAEAERAGIKDSPLLATLTAERRTNKKGNVWGVIKFTLVGPVDLGANEQAA